MRRSCCSPPRCRSRPGLLFGLVPALRTSRPDLRATLTEGARGGESRAHRTFARRPGRRASSRLSLVLLVGAGLFIQSLRAADHRRPRLRRRPSVLTLEYRLPRNKYRDGRSAVEFHQRVIERHRARFPACRSAAMAASAPQSGNGAFVGFWRAEDPQPSRDAMPRAQYNGVTDDFFRAMGIPVLDGPRVRAAGRCPAKALSVVVNRLLAERMWPGDRRSASACARRHSGGRRRHRRRSATRGRSCCRSRCAPQIYGCLSQQPGIFATVIVKTDRRADASSRAACSRRSGRSIPISRCGRFAAPRRWCSGSRADASASSCC